MTPDISSAQQQRNHRIIVLALICLTLLGLAFRLYLAWRTNQTLPDTPARLRGDEPGYESLAYGLLKGNFFDWPAGRQFIHFLWLDAMQFLVVLRHL